MSQSIRRTEKQRQSLVTDWQRSGQSVTRFCEEQDIGYASFCYWRKRLVDKGEPLAPEVSFVDLGALAACGAEFGWQIVLSLGNGVELRLSQG